MKVNILNLHKLYFFLIQLIFIEKTKISNIFQILNEVGLQELEELPPYIEKCSIVKIPEIGFLLSIPFWKSANEMTKNVFELENLNFKVFTAVYLQYLFLKTFMQ